VAKAVISQEEAVERAKRLAHERGWVWQDPASTLFRRRWLRPGGRWEILSNALALGAKVRVVLDAESGEILEQGDIPR
jgi:hypothetical protein